MESPTFFVAARFSPFQWRDGPPVCFLSPITDYRLPITDYRLPITDYRLPITDHRLLITDHRSPITDHRLIVCHAPLASPEPLHFFPAAPLGAISLRHCASGRPPSTAPGWHQLTTQIE